MTPPDEAEANMGTILYRLNQIDANFARIEGRFDRMEGGIRSLSFVGVELYKSEQTAQDQRIAGAWTLAMWALGLVCALVLGAVVTAIATVVG